MTRTIDENTKVPLGWIAGGMIVIGGIIFWAGCLSSDVSYIRSCLPDLENRLRSLEQERRQVARP